MAQEAVPDRKSLVLPRLFLAAVCLVVLAWTGRALWTALQPMPLVATDVEAAIDPSFLEGADLERLIATYQKRIIQTSTPSDYLNLGLLYLEQARLNSDPAAYAAAADSFTTAAELSPQDPTASLGQARTSLAVHDFARAEELAEGVLAQIPSRLDALAILADARMATGDIEGARRAIDLLIAGVGQIPGVLVRESELAWLEGRLEEGVEFATKAVPAEDTNPRRLSWYEASASNAAWRAGRLDESRQWSDLALDHDPDSILALSLAARHSAAEGMLEEAADLYEEATAGVPDPELVGELGDVYQQLGRTEEAGVQWELVNVIGTLAKAQGLYDRSVARFYADHSLEMERALGLAETEIKLRQDPLGYDTLAWTLYRAGRPEEALAAVASARAGGFLSAEVLYHHGLILMALGEEEKGVSLLEKALALNPSFDLRGAADAREILER